MEQLEFKQLDTLEQRREHWPLLLDADPCREMVLRYLDMGRMYVALLEGRVAAEAVVVPVEEQETWEVKNIAVLPQLQGQGVGRRLMLRLEQELGDVCSRLIVGTSDNGTGFYESCGYRYYRTIDNFFTDNYPEPIFDKGQQVVDMHYLEKEIGG